MWVRLAGDAGAVQLTFDKGAKVSATVHKMRSHSWRNNTLFVN